MQVFNYFLHCVVGMGLTQNYFLYIFCLTEVVLPKFSLVEVEEKEDSLETEVFRVNSSSSGDYSLDRECGGVGLRCSVQNSDKIVSNTCKFKYEGKLLFAILQQHLSCRSPSGVSYNVNRYLNRDGLTCQCQASLLSLRNIR